MQHVCGVSRDAGAHRDTCGTCTAAHCATQRDCQRLLPCQPQSLDMHSQNRKAGPALCYTPNHFPANLIRQLMSTTTPDLVLNSSCLGTSRVQAAVERGTAGHGSSGLGPQSLMPPPGPTARPRAIGAGRHRGMHPGFVALMHHSAWPCTKAGEDPDTLLRCCVGCQDES